MSSPSSILIIDYGSQLTQLIAKQIRSQKYYSEIYPFDYNFETLNLKKHCAIIFSGGPYSAVDDHAAPINPLFFDLNVPLLGICYGSQRAMVQLGGQVEASLKREFGQTRIFIKEESPLFKGINKETTVLMSHSDHITKLAPNFKLIAVTENNVIAALQHETNPWFFVQFHPEALHSVDGEKMFHNFLSLVNAQANWTMEDFIGTQVKNIKDKVKNDRVLLAISGGVDSLVSAVLLNKAIGDQLDCVFVDHGLLRLNEQQEVITYIQKNFHFNLHIIEAQNRFLKALEGVLDPEEKRKIIGKLFVEEFEEFSKTKLQNIKYLAQGTIYPDVIESAGNSHAKGKVIKSHHNVGGLPEKLSLKILEPLRMLFKDEVRSLGILMDIPHSLIHRHPFPGPGLGIRILGEIKKEYIAILQKADSIFIEELRKNDLYDKVQQAFCVFLPVKSVGVKGDNRTYEYTIALRAIETKDFMTSHFSYLSFPFLNTVSTRITNEVENISRVVYDISNKPPATIEWE